LAARVGVPLAQESFCLFSCHFPSPLPAYAFAPLRAKHFRFFALPRAREQFFNPFVRLRPFYIRPGLNSRPLLSSSFPPLSIPAPPHKVAYAPFHGTHQSPPPSPLTALFSFLEIHCGKSFRFLCSFEGLTDLFLLYPYDGFRKAPRSIRRRFLLCSFHRPFEKTVFSLLFLFLLFFARVFIRSGLR